MSERFKDIYRIPSARLQNWDYRWNGAYFVTICTQKQLSYFGEIITPNVEGVQKVKIIQPQRTERFFAKIAKN